MLPLIEQHSTLLLAVAAYVAIAAVNSLPDPATEQFHFYPWIYHTAKMLLNAVPAKYQAKIQSGGTPPSNP